MKSFLLMTVLTFITEPCAARNRDHKADLVAIAARYVAAYASVPHKAGDTEAQFIEDVVIPAVKDVVAIDGEQLSSNQLKAIFDFIVAADALANEDVSEMASVLYISQKSGLCNFIGKLDQSKRGIVFNRVKSL